MRRLLAAIVVIGVGILAAGCGAGSSTGDAGMDATVPDVPGDVVPEVAPDVPPVDACAGNTAFEVGAGVYDITGSTVGRGMMGYVIMSQIDEGLHMRLHARAFVIASPCNGKRVALVVTEDQAMFQAVQMEVVKRLRAKYGDLYTDANVLLSATHNHSGPGGLSAYSLYQFMPVGGFDPWHFEVVVDGIVKAIGRAHDSLQPGRVRLAQGDLQDTGINRSPDAFATNPEADRSGFPNQIDTTNTVLRLEATDGTPVGAMDFFGVHVTSVGANNKLITSDNKGYAAYLFERAMGADHAAAAGFTAGFFNTTAGDVSPNVHGFSFEAKDGVKDFADMKESALKQYQGAKTLFDGATQDLVGPVDYRQQFVKMDAVTVLGRYADGTDRSTCPAATGMSMFAGGLLDWPGSTPQGETCAKLEGSYCTDCQAEKPISVPIGDSDPPLAPNVMPFQIIRLGSLVLAGEPFETTTVAGLRIRQTLGATLAPAGVQRVVVVGYSNAYAGYMTTREEYALQDYEGASTQFGPWQLAAVTQSLDGLATAMRDGLANDPGPAPVDRVPTTDKLGELNDRDGTPDGTPFGDVAQDVAESVDKGGTATAIFWSAHPANDLRIQGTYLAVERKDGGTWIRVADDGAFETRMRWARKNCAPAADCSQATITWEIPPDAAAGAYRIKHFGSSKGMDGTLTPFEGTSREFVVP
jgi:neutral ceramidase